MNQIQIKTKKNKIKNQKNKILKKKIIIIIIKKQIQSKTKKILKMNI